MVNTRILTQEFDYHRPGSLAEAFELLAQYGDSAKVIAGGTDVVPQLKYEKITPNHLITLMKIPGLSDIKQDSGGLNIGACARLRDVKQTCARNPRYAALHDALCSIGKVQVMNMGTLGGNLCTASPAADSLPPLLVLNGRVALANRAGSRALDLEDFITGPYTAAMAGDEIMTEIQIPETQDQGSAFLKVARVAADISKLSCAVALQRDAERCGSCRIALGAVAPVPMRIRGAEELLGGRRIDSALLDEAAASVSAEIRPISDVRSTEAYRRQVAAVIFKDVFDMAWQRAGGKR